MAVQEAVAELSWGNPAPVIALKVEALAGNESNRRSYIVGGIRPRPSDEEKGLEQVRIVRK